MYRLVARKPLNREVEACDIPSKDVENLVRALEDFELEQDQSFEDWVEIIDHATPKTTRPAKTSSVKTTNKAAKQDSAGVKDTKEEAIKEEKQKGPVPDDAVLTKGLKFARLAGNVNK
ncbi:uncharacterized protein BKA55DRAFT_579825 [Fusarium redolens]|jgi:hypothetical protein|uniref:Uncharacterized protein n=1 Tax=Fusarium redolens TaxID=48865 RepID=A0A9P9JWE1_FUSRE|nr:uncharacterized protein BKA55DRAFT_579825 [Fusarium redolens]KAH7235035.1 hypothetical protein BKA55DRAFT_579825 [Fusarium redolens]